MLTLPLGMPDHHIPTAQVGQHGRRYITEIGVPLEEHFMNVVEGLKTVRGELGL